LSQRCVLCQAPDGSTVMEVGIQLQSTVGVFAPRACAVEVDSPLPNPMLQPPAPQHGQR